jgi:hypothetical protein
MIPVDPFRPKTRPSATATPNGPIERPVPFERHRIVPVDRSAAVMAPDASPT